MQRGKKPHAEARKNDRSIDQSINRASPGPSWLVVLSPRAMAMAMAKTRTTTSHHHVCRIPACRLIIAIDKSELEVGCNKPARSQSWSASWRPLPSGGWEQSCWLLYVYIRRRALRRVDSTRLSLCSLVQSYHIVPCHVICRLEC